MQEDIVSIAPTKGNEETKNDAYLVKLISKKNEAAYDYEGTKSKCHAPIMRSFESRQININKGVPWRKLRGRWRRSWCKDSEVNHPEKKTEKEDELPVE